MEKLLNLSNDNHSASPLLAKIKKIQWKGILVELPNGMDGWLPSEEWSYEQTEWSLDSPKLRIGYPIMVIEWGKSFQDIKSFSRRRVDKNPWNNITSELIGEIKLISVNRLTKKFAIGDIEPGLQGKIELASFDRYMKEQDPKKENWTHTWISYGDIIGGIVTRINFPNEYDEPEFILDAYKLLKKMEEDSEIFMSQGKVFSMPDPLHVRTSHHMAVNSLDLGHIFLLDDNISFLKAVKKALETSGYQVTDSSSKEEAIYKLKDLEVDSLHVALIDPHLIDDENKHDGLEVAKFINENQPRCKIILISGEEVGEHNKFKIKAKIRDCEDLSISAYLEKPLTINQLHNEITLATSAPSRPLIELIPFFSKGSLHDQERITRSYEKESNKITQKWTIQDALNDLGKELDGVIIHVFEMHPKKKFARSINHYGEGLNWEAVRHKLAKSPVRDTAVDPQRVPWKDDDVQTSMNFIRKHYWLLKAMNYRSSLGIPIWSSSLMGYCLLAFHPEPNKFSSEFIAKANLCAERVGRDLELKILLTQTEEYKRFETSGMAFAILGHELRTTFTALSSDAYVIQNIFEKAFKKEIYLSSGEIKIIESLRNKIDRAITITQTFDGVRSQGAIQKIDVLECLDDAIRAINQQVFRKNFKAKRLKSNSKKYFVSGSRSGLLLAFFNILLNAGQQIELFVRSKGEVWVEWESCLMQGNYWINININDNGPGIHVSDFERVFEVGYSTKKNGTGLGLHISRTIINDIGKKPNNGSVKIAKSIIGVGTTVSIFLPTIA